MLIVALPYDKGILIGSDNTEFESMSFVKTCFQIGDLPVVTCIGYNEDTAVVSHLLDVIESFFYTKLKDDFTVLNFKAKFNTFYKILQNFNQNFYLKEGISGTVFDMIIAGVDKDNRRMLYYITFGREFKVDDVMFSRGYITNLLGLKVSYGIRSYLLPVSGEIDLNIAEKIVLSTMFLASNYIVSVGKNFQVIKIDSDGINYLKPEKLQEKMAEIENIWQSLWNLISKFIKIPESI